MVVSQQKLTCHCHHLRHIRKLVRWYSWFQLLLCPPSNRDLRFLLLRSCRVGCISLAIVVLPIHLHVSMARYRVQQYQCFPWVEDHPRVLYSPIYLHLVPGVVDGDVLLLQLRMGLWYRKFKGHDMLARLCVYGWYHFLVILELTKSEHFFRC